MCPALIALYYTSVSNLNGYNPHDLGSIPDRCYDYSA